MFGGADPGLRTWSRPTSRSARTTSPSSWRGARRAVERQEPARAEERAAGADRRQHPRVQLGRRHRSGYAILFTPRNQDGTAPWSVVQKVQFTNNVVRHTASGINILGNDNEHPSQPTNNIVVRNNLFDDVSGRTYGGDGRFVLINGGRNITFDHNTVMQDGWTSLYADGAATTGFVFTNNIVPDYSWAVMGGNTGPGNGSIATYFPAGVFSKGIFAGAPSGSYPLGNYFPVDLAAVGFVDLANRNYRLGTGSLYRNAATDGTDVGCNIDTLNTAAGTRY